MKDIEAVEWDVFLGSTMLVFAVLETRAIRSNGQRATLSRVLRRRCRQRRAAKAAFLTSTVWLTYHVLWQELDDAGTSQTSLWSTVVNEARRLRSPEWFSGDARKD